MGPSVLPAAPASPLERLQIPFRPDYDGDPKKVQKHAWWVLDGEAIAICIALTRKAEHPRLPYTRKEAAALVGMKENQLAAQIAAVERPQTERFEHHPTFTMAMEVAKALQRPGVFEVRWVITAKVQP